MHLHWVLTAFGIFSLSGLSILAAPPAPSPSVDHQPAALRHRITGLWLMGQSLCDGSDSLPLVTTQPSTSGALMFQLGVRTWVYGDHHASPEQRPEDQFTFVPLQPAIHGGLGETMANGLADHLAALEKSASYLVTYAGQGGRTIGELSAADEALDPRTPDAKRQGGGYFKTSLDDARRAMQQAQARGDDFAIAALVWMQGEANGGPTGGIVPHRWDAELPRPTGQEWYRDQLIAYRKRWSAELGDITGQHGELPMFTYQTLGAAGEAQLMAADRDPHLYLVGPHYAVPSALNGVRNGQHGAAIHLAADGERWWGEQVAKVMHRVLVDGENWQPLRPLKAQIAPDRASIFIDFYVPRPPLVVDQQFLARQQSGATDAFTMLDGFRITSNTAAVPLLRRVTLDIPTRLRLHLKTPLKTDTAYFLHYGFPYAGDIGVLASTRPGSPLNGQPGTDYLVTGDLNATLKPLTNEGAFYLMNSSGAQTVVRSVVFENGATILRTETRELRNQTPFTPGDKLTALRPFSYGNLHDSDTEPSVHHFSDPSYGARTSQPYPLWNWCILFNNFPISETRNER